MIPMISWKDYHIGIRHQHSTLFIGKKRIDPKTGKEEWSSMSGNRTDEIIGAVIDKFSRDLKKKNDTNKPYVGRYIPGIGKLVFIREGFDFSVKPSPRKKAQ